MMTRSGARASSPISVTSASLPASSALASGSTVKNPSAWENAVTAPEPLPLGKAIGPSSPATSETSTNSSAELGGDAHRYARGNSPGRLRRQSGTGADHRRDEGVEGEDRRGRKSRQHDQRLVADDRKTKRLARLERDTVHQNAGLAEFRHDAMRQIAGAF